jgi:hypothetical protein
MTMPRGLLLSRACFRFGSTMQNSNQQTIFPSPEREGLSGVRPNAQLKNWIINDQSTNVSLSSSNIPLAQVHIA